jgi:hypothetical protein
MYGRDCGGESIANDCQLPYVMHYFMAGFFGIRVDLSVISKANTLGCFS